MSIGTACVTPVKFAVKVVVDFLSFSHKGCQTNQTKMTFTLCQKGRTSNVGSKNTLIWHMNVTIVNEADADPYKDNSLKSLASFGISSYCKMCFTFSFNFLVPNKWAKKVIEVNLLDFWYGFLNCSEIQEIKRNLTLCQGPLVTCGHLWLVVCGCKWHLVIWKYHLTKKANMYSFFQSVETLIFWQITESDWTVLELLVDNFFVLPSCFWSYGRFSSYQDVDKGVSNLSCLITLLYLLQALISASTTCPIG